MRFVLPFVLAIGIAPLPTLAQERINRAVDAPASGEVEIVNTAGSVRVTGWDRNQVAVTGTLGRGTERLDVTRSGNRTEVRVVLPRNGRNVQGSQLEVRVPMRSRAVVRTVSADLAVNDVRGVVDTRSTSGNVRVGGNPEEVQASSTSGDVEVNATTSRVRSRSTSGDVIVRGRSESIDAETVSGDVQVLASTREVRAKSVSGDVMLRDGRGFAELSTVSGDALIAGGEWDRVTAESTSGTLRFQGTLRPDAWIDMKSHSGDVELLLPANVAATFDVRTFSGDVSNAFGPAAQRTSRYGPGRELKFSTGRGGSRVTARTFSGDLILRKR